MSAFTDFHFLRPLALLLVLAVPLFWLAWRHGRGDAGAWRDAVDAHLLPHLIERIDGTRGRAGLVLAALLWTLACIALAGPTWQREPMPLYRNQAARVLALELAPSMLAQDEKPDRLSRARYKLDDTLERSRDYQTALIGYAGDAFVAAPLTDDIGTVRNLVDALDPSTMPVAGNDTARAIEAAVGLIEQAGLHRGEIILFADSVSANAEAAARKARARGFVVSILGVGSPAGAPIPLPRGDFQKDARGDVVVAHLDAARLRAVAAAGGGRYASLTANAHDLDTLLPDSGDTATRADADASVQHGEVAESARWRDQGPWLVLLLLPLALLGFRRGWLMGLALALLAPVYPAQATSFAGLWQRPDQQAAVALAHGDAKKAAQVARSPEWRGSAAYRSGDYKAAASDYADTRGADGVYNKGNALAKLGQYQEAIASYDEALKLAPDMADAKANRKAVEDFLKKSQAGKNSQSQQGKKNSPNDSKDQKQKSGQDSQSSAGDKQQDQQGGQKDRQNGQQQDSSQKPSPQPDGKDAADKSQRGQQKAASDNGSDQNGKNDKSAQAQKAAAAQQKALSKDIDKALASQAKSGAKDDKQVHAAVREDEATREKNQALDHLLQSVPDDPGGLLRRKFQLEYQQRQQRAGDGG